MVRSRIAPPPPELVSAPRSLDIRTATPPRDAATSCPTRFAEHDPLSDASRGDRPRGLWSRLLAPLRAREAAPAAEPHVDERSSRGFLFEIIAPLFGKEARSIALGFLVAIGGCAGERVEVEGVVRDGRTGRPIAGARVSTSDGRSVSTGADGRFAVEVEEGSRVTATAEGRCDVAQEASAPPLTLNLFPTIELDTEHAQVGFDREVRVEVRARCASGPLRWAQVAGPELDEARMRVEDDGRTLVVHTHPLEELVRLDDRVGVLALDREQRADYRFELRGAGAPREVRVSAAPASTGLFQVPTGADVYLNGGAHDHHAWELLERPEHSEATLSSPTARTPRFRPDRFGTYVIEHRPSRLQMSIQAGGYEDVPRDCGREGCHEPEAEGWTHTAHARTFRRGIEGELGGFEERCWSCHATGVEPGVDNGGLHHTAARLGWAQPSPDAGVWDEAPRRIRRHGSVWCSACHGPGRIVPPPFRWQYGAKLTVGVCARCHDVDAGDPDADHVSPHVDEWELAPMSRFTGASGGGALGEDDPALRRECARCHSAQGFVAWRRRDEHIAPGRATVAPISCGACHDAHDASRPFAVRVYDTSDPIAGTPAEHMGTGALCASCHRGGVVRAEDEDAAPHAPHADVLLGRGARVAPASEGGAHRWIADTCVRCHMVRPPEGDPLRGVAGGHTFSARARRGEAVLNAAACAGCHGEAEPSQIGARDWDGDGTSGPIGEEHDRAFARVAALVREGVRAARVVGPCGRAAADVIDEDARLVLVDAEGALLGDCDADGRFGDGESAVTASRLSRSLRDAAYDLELLRRDGSRGVHNPAYAFTMLGALERALTSHRP